MRIIDKCPSGALAYKNVKKAGEADKPLASIKIMKNGPLLVEADCALFEETCKEAAISGPYALCGCERFQEQAILRWNIHQEWIRRFKMSVGKALRPFQLADCREPFVIS